MSDDFFIRLERQLEAAELRELNRAPALRRIVNPRRLLSVPLAAAAAAGVVVVVLTVLGAIDNNDADRRARLRALWSLAISWMRPEETQERVWRHRWPPWNSPNTAPNSR